MKLKYIGSDNNNLELVARTTPNVKTLKGLSNAQIMHILTQALEPIL